MSQHWAATLGSQFGQLFAHVLSFAHGLMSLLMFCPARGNFPPKAELAEKFRGILEAAFFGLWASPSPNASCVRPADPAWLFVLRLRRTLGQRFRKGLPLRIKPLSAPSLQRFEPITCSVKCEQQLPTPLRAAAS